MRSAILFEIPAWVATNIISGPTRWSVFAAEARLNRGNTRRVQQLGLLLYVISTGAASIAAVVAQ